MLTDTLGKERFAYYALALTRGCASDPSIIFVGYRDL